VYSVAILKRKGVREPSVLDGQEQDSLISMLVGDILALGMDLAVRHVPDLTDSHPRGLAHCEIIGMPTGNNPRKRVRAALAELASWHTLNPPAAP
jgi:hypothetical protein